MYKTLQSVETMKIELHAGSHVNNGGHQDLLFVFATVFITIIIRNYYY